MLLKLINTNNPKNLKINKIVIFFNNYRGLNLSKFLQIKGYKIYNIVTKKFLNKKIIKNLNLNKTKFINNLRSKSLEKFLSIQKYDLMISAGFPHIFNKKFFKLSKYGIINLHAGKLPKYRGGSPLVWQIINDEKEIGLSIIKINEQIDGGSILSKAKFKNLKSHNIDIVQKKANKLFLKLTLKAITKLQNKNKLKIQPKSLSYFKQRNDKDGFIDFAKSSNDVYNFVRAQSHPYKGAFFFNKKKKFRLLKCKTSTFNPKIDSGKIFKVKKQKHLYIKCKINSIKLLELRPDIKLLKS